MDYRRILRLRVQGRSALRLCVDAQRRHAQRKSRGSQCDRELTHKSPPSVKDQKWFRNTMRGNDNPGFAELPSISAHQPLEKLKIVMAVAPSSSTRQGGCAHKTLRKFVGPSSATASQGGPARRRSSMIRRLNLRECFRRRDSAGSHHTREMPHAHVRGWVCCGRPDQFFRMAAFG